MFKQQVHYKKHKKNQYILEKIKVFVSWDWLQISEVSDFCHFPSIGTKVTRELLTCIHLHVQKTDKQEELGVLDNKGHFSFKVRYLYTAITVHFCFYLNQFSFLVAITQLF